MGRQLINSCSTQIAVVWAAQGHSQMKTDSNSHNIVIHLIDLIDLIDPINEVITASSGSQKG